MQQPDRYAAFLFDMDGTILTSIAAAERVWARWAERHGLDVERFLPTIHGKRAVDTVAAQRLDGVDVEREAEWVLEAEMDDTAGIEAAGGVAAFLASLPEARWALVTSAPRRLAIRRMEAAGLPVPGLVVAAEDVVNGKPAPDGFVMAAERLGVAIEACLVFEDSLAGIAAAEAAGAAVLVITGFQHNHVATPHSSARNYEALRASVEPDGSLRLAGAEAGVPEG